MQMQRLGAKLTSLNTAEGRSCSRPKERAITEAQKPVFERKSSARDIRVSCSSAGEYLGSGLIYRTL